MLPRWYMWCILIAPSSSAEPSCCHDGTRRDSVLSVAGSALGWRQGAGCTQTGRTHPQWYILAVSHLVLYMQHLTCIFFFSHVRFDVGNTTAAAVLTLLFTHCNKMIASFPGPAQSGNEANKMMVITILQIDPPHVITFY